MALDDEVEIDPDRCAVLSEILDMNDPDDRNCFEDTENRVRAYLFSQFPQRRELNIIRLRELFNTFA